MNFYNLTKEKYALIKKDLFLNEQKPYFHQINGFWVSELETKEHHENISHFIE